MEIILGGMLLQPLLEMILGMRLVKVLPGMNDTGIAVMLFLQLLPLLLILLILTLLMKLVLGIMLLLLIQMTLG